MVSNPWDVTLDSSASKSVMRQSDGKVVFSPSSPFRDSRSWKVHILVGWFRELVAIIIKCNYFFSPAFFREQWVFFFSQLFLDRKLEKFKGLLVFRHWMKKGSIFNLYCRLCVIKANYFFSLSFIHFLFISSRKSPLSWN